MKPRFIGAALIDIGDGTPPFKTLPSPLPAAPKDSAGFAEFTLSYLATFEGFTGEHELALDLIGPNGERLGELARSRMCPSGQDRWSWIANNFKVRSRLPGSHVFRLRLDGTRVHRLEVVLLRDDH